MKQEISCEIIQDLLPVYIEGLASPSSILAVEAHLRHCEKCSNVYSELTVPIAAEPATSDGVDALKKLRRSIKLRSAVILLLAVLILGGLFKVFIHGYPIQWNEAVVEQWIYSEEEETVTLEGYLIQAKAVSRHKLAPTGNPGEYSLIFYAVPLSPFFKSDTFSITIPYDEGKTIVFPDQEQGSIPVVNRYTFASFIAYYKDDPAIPTGGLTANREHLRLIRKVIERAKDTSILQTGTPPVSNYVQISLHNNSISYEDLDREYDVILYAYEQDGRYYLEEIKQFYGELYEFRENFWTRDVVETIANRKYVREINESDYMTLMRVIETVSNETDSLSGSGAN